MEQNKDVYRDWVVVSDGIKSYIGKETQREGNCVQLVEAFELKILELHQPDPTGRGVQTILQNLHVTEPLCSESVQLEVYVTKYRRFQWLNDRDRNNHIGFVESAVKAFMAQRLKLMGLELPSA